jgi:hypothetical protein
LILINHRTLFGLIEDRRNPSQEDEKGFYLLLGSERRLAINTVRLPDKY